MPEWMFNLTNSYNAWWHDHPVVFYSVSGACIATYLICRFLGRRK